MSDESKTLVEIPPPAKFRFMSYCGDRQGCGTIRIIYPTLLLNQYRPEKQQYLFEADYLTSFVNDPNFYKTYTFVQFQRSATEQHLKIFQHYVKHLRKFARVPIVYEIDDLLMDIPNWNYAASYYNNNPTPIFEMMKLVDGMTTSTEDLKKAYSPYCNNIQVIPNHLSKFIWGDVRPKHLRNPRELKDRPRIGWAGSENHFCNPKTKEFKEGLRGGDFGHKLMDFIRKTVDKYQWVLSGAFPVELEDVRDKIEHYGWVSIFQYPNHLKKLDLDICMAILQPCHFNDCKCLIGNTKVISSNGIMNIKDVSNIHSLYQHNSFESVSSNIMYSNKNTIKITTKRGYTIEGTPNHKITQNGKYIQLDKLRIGDKVDISFFEYPSNVPYTQEFVPFFLTKKLDSIDMEKLDNTMIPTITLNEKWGYFLGMFLGDGNIGQSDTINISCDDRENIADIMTDFGEHIGVNTFIGKSDKRNEHGLCVHFSSRNLKWLLSNKFGFNGGKFKKNLNIPKQIMMSPKSVIKEFIMGLFDADGTVTATGCEFTTKNKQLAEDIQFLLLGFHILSNIRSHFNTKYNRMYYTLNLGRQASDVFVKEIGFRCKQKFDKLEIITSKKYSNKYKEWEMNDEIVDIQLGNSDVYDVEIPNNHFYVANGFVSHNSNIKSLEYTVIGCPAVYSDASPYRDMTYVSNNDEEIIDYIERLAESIDLRKEVFEKDYAKVKEQLFWEDSENLWKYVNSYLALFGKKMRD